MGSYLPMILPLLSLLVMASQSPAGEGECAHCGCGNGCQKVCRLVKEDKKITITCWGCKSEDFCAPGRSKPGCKHCETVCDEDDPDSPCVRPKEFSWTEWIPCGCGKVFTKKKLMKKTITKTVPGYKWVVEDLCAECEAACPMVTPAPGAIVPPPPVIDAELK